jgi:fructose-1,6-bisphosphatase/inositol monophosphatase family enzyme
MSSELLAVLNKAVDAVTEALARQQDWSAVSATGSQYHHDLVADLAALAVLDAAGLGALSEESGLHHPERPVTVVLDPVDGSTNASRGLPWWAVSLCALDAEGPLVAVVAGPALGVRYEAVRGEGARRNGRAVHPSTVQRLASAMVVLNGYPDRHFGWAQYRSFGAAALDMCSVACGELDGFVDCSANELAPWDYLGALLVCREAGGSVSELYGRELVARQLGERHSVVAAATPALLGELLAARRPS